MLCSYDVPKFIFPENWPCADFMLFFNKIKSPIVNPVPQALYLSPVKAIDPVPRSLYHFSVTLKDLVPSALYCTLFLLLQILFIFMQMQNIATAYPFIIIK